VRVSPGTERVMERHLIAEGCFPEICCRLTRERVVGHDRYPARYRGRATCGGWGIGSPAFVGIERRVLLQHVDEHGLILARPGLEKRRAFGGHGTLASRP
jgi:hypothetical protein